MMVVDLFLLLLLLLFQLLLVAAIVLIIMVMIIDHVVAPNSLLQTLNPLLFANVNLLSNNTTHRPCACDVGPRIQCNYLGRAGGPRVSGAGARQGARGTHCAQFVAS